MFGVEYQTGSHIEGHERRRNAALFPCTQSVPYGAHARWPAAEVKFRLSPAPARASPKTAAKA